MCKEQIVFKDDFGKYHEFEVDCKLANKIGHVKQFLRDAGYDVNGVIANDEEVKTLIDFVEKENENA